MTEMVEIETQNFLRELDSFGLPPPPQKLFSNNYSKAFSREFENKLHHINVEKQMRTKKIDSKPSPSSNSFNCTEKKEISSEDVKSWKNQVLIASRPTNPWYEQQRTTDIHKKAQRDNMREPRDHQKNSISKQLSVNIATISGENTFFNTEVAKKYQYSNKLGSLSPLSNAETSGSSVSEGSNASCFDRNDGIYHARPYNDNDCIAGRTPSKTYYHSGPPLRVGMKNKQYTDLINRSLLRSNGNGHCIRSKNIAGKAQIISTSNGNAKILPPNSPSSNKSFSDATKTKTCTDLKNVTTLSWRQKKPENLQNLDANNDQREKYEELADRIEKKLAMNSKIIGTCGICEKPVLDEGSITFALGQLYHQCCFICTICGRTLAGKKFYKVKGRTYCEEDYLYAGVHETAERCAACSHLIIDLVLQALGKSYHPRCFRCECCKTCLDGIPFALDSRGKIYCIDDYHKLFAPKCATCHKPILASTNSGETVRVVAINKDYHVECYVCEGCGKQLTDEKEKRCYPLNDHLFCKDCHLQWAKIRGTQQSITDV